MTPNPGHCPDDAIGKRVRVRLAHGGIGAVDNSPITAPGWAAEGRGGCRWSLTGDRFDIAEYEVVR